MKKLLALICMITCIFGLTACGSEEALSDYEQYKIENAKALAADQVVGIFMQFDDATLQEIKDTYTVEEIQYLVSSQYGLNMKDGFSFLTAVESFNSTMEEIGSVVGIGEASAKIDDDTIIVYVQVDGELKDAEAEIIISNDMFMEVQAAALNPVSSMSDLMVKAALNTLIGMGTVFAVLILIIGIISCFALIPKIQGILKGEKKEKGNTTGIDNAVAQITTQEESVEAVNMSDDSELAAVIAAAIAAYEGTASTDGFVVRSIRKVNKGRR